MRRRCVAHGIEFDALTALDRLTWVGRDGPGALRYRPSVDLGSPDAIDIDALAGESLRITEGKSTDVIDRLVRLGGSSGGARPKILGSEHGRE